MNFVLPSRPRIWVILLVLCLCGGRSGTNAANAANAADGEPVSASQPRSGDFSVLGANDSGRTLFITLPTATTLDAAITQTADALGSILDEKPSISGAFADSQTGNRGGALFTARENGRDVRGWIFCDLGKSVAKDGSSDASKTRATACVVIATPHASQAQVSALLGFVPSNVKMTRYEFPDCSGSIDLPEGWTTQQQSASFGVQIQGPAGQNVWIGISTQVNTPNGQLVRIWQQTCQMRMQLYASQMRTYQQSLMMHQRYPYFMVFPAPVKPAAPDLARDMPGLIFCRYCAGPEEVLKYYYPVMEAGAKNAGVPYTTLDKIIDVVPAESNPYIANDKAGLAYLAVTDHEGDKITHMRVLNRIETYPIFQGQDSWVITFNVKRAPDATFDRDLPVMNDIMASFKMNMEVVTREIRQAGCAAREMSEWNERWLLRRGREFNEWQAEHFDRFERQMAAQSQARHDSSSDFIEYIRGVRDVYDTATGTTRSVDLFHVDGIVDEMNAIANDPNRFVQIPLRYER